MIHSFTDYLKNYEVEYKRDINLSTYSSIGVGGVSKVAVFPDSFYELILAVDFLHQNKMKFKVVGRMTNILFDESVEETVIIFTSKIKEYHLDGNILCAQCGACISSVLPIIAECGLGGMEQLYGIPGLVGGMVYNNAGAYGKSISDFIRAATVYDIKNRNIIKFSNYDFNFAYRYSILKDCEYLLLNAEFEMVKKDKEKIKEELLSIIKCRTNTQPTGAKSLGSVFKRIDDIPVSALIDRLGLKGLSVGGASVSPKHAGFIVNKGSATSFDVKKLISIIKERVFEEYGLKLEEEIEII